MHALGRPEIYIVGCTATTPRILLPRYLDDRKLVVGVYTHDRQVYDESLLVAFSNIFIISFPFKPCIQHPSVISLPRSNKLSGCFTLEIRKDSRLPRSRTMYRQLHVYSRSRLDQAQHQALQVHGRTRAPCSRIEFQFSYRPQINKFGYAQAQPFPQSCAFLRSSTTSGEVRLTW